MSRIIFRETPHGQMKCFSEFGEFVEGIILRQERVFE